VLNNFRNFNIPHCYQDKCYFGRVAANGYSVYCAFIWKETSTSFCTDYTINTADLHLPDGSDCSTSLEYASIGSVQVVEKLLSAHEMLTCSIFACLLAIKLFTISLNF